MSGGSDDLPESLMNTRPHYLPEHLSFLRPVIVDDLVRLGSSNDGGYVLPASPLKELDALVSFGISKDWSFEKRLKALNPSILVHAYDHTVNGAVFLRSLFWQATRLLFLRSTFADLSARMRIYASYKIFLTKDCTHYQERIFNRVDYSSDATIRKVFSRLEGFSRILLKMDIEGDEYRVIPDLLTVTNRIDLLIIEFHNTEPFREVFSGQVQSLLRHFVIVHVHGNNFGGIGNDTLPESLEITFLNRRLAASTPHYRDELPLAGLDFPNDPTRGDLPLRFQSQGTRP